jgi:hypothetical protein
MLSTSTLRPGFLVSLKTSVTGNASYIRRDIEADHLVDDKARMAKWETERTVADAEEYERASKARTAASYAVSRICAATAFGYLCTEDKEAELADAIAEARSIVDTFNATATITRLSFYVLTGRVARDDIEAARAIKSELSGLMAEMERGIKELSPVKVRDAATRAKKLATMLSDSGRSRVGAAIEAAREAATVINRAVKAGETAALTLDRQAIDRIANARTSFLDIDEVSPDEDAQTSAQPTISRALDLQLE